MSVEHATGPQDGERPETWESISRRALLKAGWAAPVILSVAPSVAFAASGTKSPGGGTTLTSPSGSRTPGPTTPTTAGEQPSSGAQSPGGGAVPEQQTEGPQPARISRGFTG